MGTHHRRIENVDDDEEEGEEGSVHHPRPLRLHHPLTDRTHLPSVQEEEDGAQGEEGHSRSCRETGSEAGVVAEALLPPPRHPHCLQYYSLSQ